MEQPVKPGTPGASYNSSQNVSSPPEQNPVNIPEEQQQQPQVPVEVGANDPPPAYGYLQLPSSTRPQSQSEHSQTTVTTAPQLGVYFSEDYHLVVNAKRTMELLSPDRKQTLFTVQYPKSGDGPSLTVKRGGIDGPKIGCAVTHCFTTSKVDVEMSGRKLRFKKSFESTTGQGQLTWSLDSGTLLLEDRKGLLARFIPKDGEVKSRNRQEGRLEIRRQELNAEQFEEIVITCLAELERRRNDAEFEEDIVYILTFQWLWF